MDRILDSVGLSGADDGDDFARVFEQECEADVLPGCFVLFAQVADEGVEFGIGIGVIFGFKHFGRDPSATNG